MGLTSSISISTSRPDMTLAVDWTLKASYLSIPLFKQLYSSPQQLAFLACRIGPTSEHVFAQSVQCCDWLNTIVLAKLSSATDFMSSPVHFRARFPEPTIKTNCPILFCWFRKSELRLLAQCLWASSTGCLPQFFLSLPIKPPCLHSARCSPAS